MLQRPNLIEKYIGFVIKKYVITFYVSHICYKYRNHFRWKFCIYYSFSQLVTVFGDDFEGMKEIQRVSKATIGILADAESNLLRHSFLDILGTTEEITSAEELILDKTLKVIERNKKKNYDDYFSFDTYI